MTERTDEQVLAEAMGMCWHTPIPANLNRIKVHYKCSKCGRHVPKNWSCTFTQPAELWNLLMYMVNRKDWNEFYVFSWYEYHGEQNTSGKCSTLPAYMRWLLTDRARFVKLCADWCREHEEARS